jgi:acyl-CoA synthetase (AMP-forming)/AMP-acid ligase II
MHEHRNGCLIDLLRDRAAQQPNDRAFTFLDDGERPGPTLTWQQLERRSRAIGAVIAGRVPRGARVLVMLPPSIDFIPAFFGVLYAGAVAIPAYPPGGGRADRTIGRLRGMIGDAGVALVVALDAPVNRASFDVAVPELRRLPRLDPASVDDRLADTWHPSPFHADSLALLQYTSGSTAMPRGVMVSHANLLHNLAATAHDGRYTRESVSVSWLPVNHDMGLINGVLQPMFSGCEAYLMAPAAFLQRPARWLQAISRYGGTHSGGPNFAYDLCVRRVDEGEAATLDLGCWRVAYNGSEPVRRATLEAFQAKFGTRGFRWEALSPAYGLAESTLFVTGVPADSAPQFRGDAVASGVLPRHGSRMLIVDPTTRCTVADGSTGEIWVSGPSVARGYWNRPQQTAETFHAYTSDRQGPFLRTGDLGQIDAGRLFVTGRIKDVLIVRGVKHHPHDIELTAESAHRAVRAGCCAAVALQVDGDERVALIAELDARGPGRADAIDPAGVLIAIRTAVVASHAISLHSVTLVPPGTLPKTTSGKLQRFLCRDALVNGTLEPIASWIDADTMERAAS